MLPLRMLRGFLLGAQAATKCACVLANPSRTVEIAGCMPRSIYASSSHPSVIFCASIGVGAASGPCTAKPTPSKTPGVCPPLGRPPRRCGSLCAAVARARPQPIALTSFLSSPQGKDAIVYSDDVLSQLDGGHRSQGRGGGGSICIPGGYPAAHLMPFATAAVSIGLDPLDLCPPALKWAELKPY